jgi:hypothetical protein
MDAKPLILRLDVRESPAYARAVKILSEKREVLCKLNELNRELRCLSNQDVGAVAAARLDISFRSPSGGKTHVQNPSK